MQAIINEEVRLINQNTSYESLRNEVAKLINYDLYKTWRAEDKNVKYFHGTEIHPAMYNWQFDTFMAYFANAITEDIFNKMGIEVPEEKGND